MKSIGTVGFNPAEINLLVKQLKIVSAKINAGWQYIGETSDADLVFSKNRIPTSGLTKLVLVGDADAESGELVVESPIRLMQLTDVLENNSEGVHSGALFLSNLFSSRNFQNSSITVDSNRVFFFPNQKKVGGNFPNFESLINVLHNADLNNAKLDSNDVPTDPSSLSVVEHSKRAMWHLAKLEKDFANARYSPQYKYKLSNWPRVTRWDKDMSLTRLASVFTRHALDIKTAATACRVSVEQVKLFLHCCEASGASVRTDDTLHLKQATVANNQHDEKSLGWLKKRIRKMLNYDN